MLNINRRYGTSERDHLKVRAGIAGHDTNVTLPDGKVARKYKSEISYFITSYDLSYQFQINVFIDDL